MCVKEHCRSSALERLKRQGVVVLQEFERFVTMAEKRCRDQTLAKHLQESRGRGKPLRSLAQLQEVMGEHAYSKLTKGMFE